MTMPADAGPPRRPGAGLPPALQSVAARAAEEFRLLLVAIQFLTRLPVPSFPAFEPSWLDRSAKYFPVVGLIVGLISGGVLIAASGIWPPWIAAMLAVAASVAMTGAFHEDGLADTADGLGGGLTRERRLEIMKDSRVGTYGAIALVITLGLRVACLASIDPETGSIALVAAHTAARLAPLIMIRLAPYAGDEGVAKVKPLATGLYARELAFAGIVTAGAMIMTLGFAAAAIAALAAAVLAGAIARLSLRLIGGYTGDVLGAMEQAAEVAILLAVTALF